MDSSRFKHILLPLNATLYRTAYRIIKDSDIAKDMVQEAYVSLWHKRDSLDGLENVEAFAIKVVRNRCVDYLRTTHVYSMIDNTTENIPDESVTAEDTYENNERLSGVMLNLNQLPERQRQVLMMRTVQDLTLEEIEKLTGLSNVNVRTLLSRARKRLKELCESDLMG